MDDLKQRLRKQAGAFHPESLVATTATEAAAALDAKDAEIARLKRIIATLIKDAEHISFDVLMPPGHPPAEFTKLHCRQTDYEEARAAITDH